MNRILAISLMSAALAACVSEPDPGSSSSVSESSESSLSSATPLSSATQESSSSVSESSSSINPVSSSSIASVSSSSIAPSSSSAVSSSSVVSSSAPVQSSSSVASSSPSGFDGDASRGFDIFSAKCDSCHLDANGDGYFGEASNAFDPDSLGDAGVLGLYDASTRDSLAAFISDSMDAFSGGCDEQCGEDVAAYLWLQKNGLSEEEQIALLTGATCPDDSAGAIHYGRRAMYLLRSFEYHNSLQKLFLASLPVDYSSNAKVSPDNDVAELPNHINANVSETRMNAYYENATELADWAIATPGALPFECENAGQCAEDLITEFAYVAYRRALNEQEQSLLTNIIIEAEELQSGLKWALTTVLSSPQFLYRYELGTQVSELIANPVVAPGTRLTFEGEPEVFSDISINRYSRINVRDSGTYLYEWTGNDAIAITVSGTKSPQDKWPVLTIGYGEETILDLTVDHASTRTYYIESTAPQGSNIHFWHNANLIGDYQANPIVISELKVGKLGEAKPVVDDLDSLNAAEQTAYALDPYEYASALAFALTGSGPDKALLDSAVAGDLVDDAAFDAIVDDLINSELGREHVQRLAGIWFRTDGLGSQVRNDDAFTSEVADAMMQEIREIYQHAFFNGNFPAVYSGDFTYLDSTLADFYGMTGQGGSTPGDFQLVDTSASNRGGVIASGAYMAYNAHMDHTSPVLRSTHFRQDVLCQLIPQPVNLDDSDERDAANKLANERVESGSITTAEYYDIQTNVPGSSCATCHNAIINPLFGLDDFDHVGRLRKRVNGDVVQDGLAIVNMVIKPAGQADLPIDFVNEKGLLVSENIVGTLVAADADDEKDAGNGIAFSGAKDLGKKIVERNVPGIEQCMIEKNVRYATGYTLQRNLLLEEERNGPTYLQMSNEQEAEFQCVRDELATAYDANSSPKDVLRALVKSSAFRFRK